MKFINGKYGNSYLCITLFLACWSFSNVNAQTLKIYDSISKRRDTILLPQTIVYPVSPNERSIWVNRETPYKDYTPEELLRNVFISNYNGTSCSQISNVSLIGTGWDDTSWTDVDRSLSYFSHGTLVINGLNIEEGLLLTTGRGLNVEGPNESPSGSGLGGGVPIVDPDLSMYNITTGAILQFDFVPQIDTIAFEYVFASEEYPEYVGFPYNDVFGFFISGPGITGTRNIALIPGTNTPVTINNVNVNYNSAYYKSNEPSDYCEYDGHTVVLTTDSVAVIPGQTYHLKLAIANVGDNYYGSGVFLKAKSLDIGFDIRNYGNMTADMDNIFAGCSNNKLTITTSVLPNVSTVNLNYSGTAVNDIVQLDNSPMPTTVTVPANTSQIDIFYKVKDVISVNGGTFIISYTSVCTGSVIEKTIHVYDKIISQVTATNSCNDDGIIQVSTSGGTANAQMSIDSGANWQSVNIPFAGLISGTYTVLVRDSVSCMIDTFSVEIYNEKPVITDELPDKVVCSGTPISKINFNSSIQGTTFEWTNDNTNIGLPAEGIDSIQSFIANNSTNEPITATITVIPTYNYCAGTPLYFAITVNPVYDSTIYATICLGETYRDGDGNFDKTPTVAGVVTDSVNILTVIGGCDSIIRLHLTVNQTYNDTIIDTICLGEVYNQYNFNETPLQSGNFTFVNDETTTQGCDSLTTLNLFVKPSYHDTLQREICLGKIYKDDNFDTIPIQAGFINVTRNHGTTLGCDSAFTLLLTVHPIYDSTIYATICLGETYRDGDGNFDKTPTVAGIVTDSVNISTAIGGCDSIIRLHLTVNQTYYDTIIDTICLGEVYNQYNFNETPLQSGNFTFVNDKTTAQGCDSITTLLLTVNHSYHDTIKAAICQNEYYSDYGFYVAAVQRGIFTYVHDLTTSKNCDSVTTLQLTVNPVYDEYRHERIYEDEFYTVGNYKYNTPGLHISNLQTVEGCDSIINLYLDIIYYPPELTAFTPLNKDGVNDYFMPGFKVQILNRNGTLIYETKTVEEQALGWDGRNAKGQNVEPGLYFYILYNSSGKPRIKSSVEVLKK